MSATAVDETGNEGTATVTVVVDRARPRITWLRPTSDLAITDDSSDAPGIQSFLVLSVEDGSDGQTVTIRQESAALDEPTVVETDPLSGLLVYVDEYTLSDGVVTLTAWTSDDAGNRSLDTAVSFTVASDLAGALLSDPGSGSSVNLDDDISGVPGIQMNVRANVFGAFDEHDAHLCIASEDAGTYPEPCDSVGFRRMASAVVAANEAVFPSVSLPDGRITLLVEIVLGDGTVVPPFAPTLVLVDSVAPILEGFEVLGDTNEDGYLNGDESDTDSLPASTSLRANFFGIEDGRTARVTTDNPAPGTLLGTGDVVGGTVLVPVEFNQGTHTLEVSVSDLAGNEVAEGAPSIALIVDTIGPTVEVAAPGAGARLLAEDDLNIEPSDGLQYEVVVTTDAMTGSTVALSSDGDGGARDIGELTVGDGRAAGTETLPEGANTITAQVSDTAGNLGSDTNDFFVDSMPPSIAFTAPVGPTAVSSGDDLELGTGGIQIDVAVSTEDAEVGQPIVIRSLLSGALVSDGVTVAGAGAQTVRVTLRAPGVHTLEASVTDINGNVATADSTTITLTLEGCAILFVDLDPVMTYFNAADDSDGDPDNGIDVDIPVVVADGACVGETASLHLDGGGAPIATATIGADLTTTFTAVHLAHGDAGTLEAEVTHDGALSSTGEFAFTVDLIAPSIDAITPGTGDPVPVGSAQASAVSGDGFVDFALDTTGAVGGALSINEDAALLADVAVDADTVVASSVVFAAGSHTLVFTLHDAAGNSTTATRNYLVDWTRPDVTDFLIELLNRRSGETSLSWRFDGDATRYEIRAALIEIDDATWDNPAVSTLATVSDVSGVGVDELLEHHIDSLAFQQRHYLAMRAVDEVGNESPVAGGNVFVGMLSIDLATTAAAVDDAASIGDVNNDGYADAIISGANAPLQVFYGAENIEDGFITPIAPPAGSSFFGISAHGVGDVNGDGLPDVMVGAPLTAPRGTAYLYFGRDGSPLPADPDVTFDYSSPSASPFFGYSLTDGGGDVTRLAGEAPGDVIDDLVIAAIAEGDGGAAYVIAGRETWPATFTVSNDPEINHAQGVATITGVSAGARFGRSIAIPGDVDMSADGLADFVIGAYSATTLETGEIYYFYGRPMADFPSTGLTADDADRRVLGPFAATFWVADGIGVLPDVDGDGAPEWMLWDRNRAAVDVFLGGDPPPTEATYRYTGTTPAGLDVDFGRFASSAGDIDALNGPDVLVRVSRGIGSPDDGHFAVLLNDGTGDFRLGEALAFIDVDGGRPTGVGDLNNDGYADFIVVVPGTLSDTDLRIYY